MFNNHRLVHLLLKSSLCFFFHIKYNLFFIFKHVYIDFEIYIWIIFFNSKWCQTTRNILNTQQTGKKKYYLIFFFISKWIILNIINNNKIRLYLHQSDLMQGCYLSDCRFYSKFPVTFLLILTAEATWLENLQAIHT